VTRFSILINNHNYGRYLAAAIGSALEQQPPPHEVVVVDDGSTDGSPAVIAGFTGRIRAILKPNGGQASAFNAGVAVSTGDVLCFLDADDAVLPGKCARLAEVYADPGIAWCFHRLRPADADLRPLDPPVVIGPVGRCDLRQAIRRNRLPDLPTATSGLSLRRDLAARIFPMPQAEDVILSDNFVKLRAAALAPGWMLAESLALLRLHGENRYSGGGEARARLAPRIAVRTALELDRLDPDLRRFCDGLFRGGLRDLAAALGWRAACAEPAVAEYFARRGRLPRAVLCARVALAQTLRRGRHDG